MCEDLTRILAMVLYANMRRPRPDREDNHGAGRHDEAELRRRSRCNISSCAGANNQTTGRIARFVAQNGNESGRHCYGMSR